MIYLASPYSHPDESVRLRRYLITTEFVWSRQEVIFSPIAYGHQFATLYGAPYEADFWEHFNFSMLQRADELWVLQLSGWDYSQGIKTELAWAKTLGIPVQYKEPPRDASL